MNRKVLILLGIFVLSRVFFINPLPVFFDSSEYLIRLSNLNYFQAIISGHAPLHPSYIILFWPIFHIFNLLNINPSFAVIFTQTIFSSIAIYCFYRLVEIIVNKKTAIIAATISALMPIYWIVNVSIMTESTCVNFFIISAYFLAKYLKSKLRLTYLVLGLASFSLALLTNPLVILWTPLLLSIVYCLRKDKFLTMFLSIILAVFFAILINSFFISSALKISLLNGVSQYLFGVDIKITPDVSSLLSILRFIRNAFMQILQNSTSIILILSFISFIRIFKKNKKLFVIAVLWILPIIITSQWYDPLLFGRHGLIAGFGFAFLTAIFLEKRRTLFFAIIGYMLVISLPALFLLRQPIPYLQVQEFVKTLPQGLLIESHFARPQIERNYSGEIIFINEPGWSKENLKKTIDTYLIKAKPIFITSQALSDPYGIYSGPFLYPLSLSYAKDPELGDTMISYLMKKYQIIDEKAGLTIYKIISKEKSKYPNIPKLNNNEHRIDYFDPVIQLWFLIDKAKIIQSHSMIKG